MKVRKPASLVPTLLCILLAGLALWCASASAAIVEEEAVSNVSASATTFFARIAPEDVPTTYYFQYGTDAGYGTDVPAPPGAPLDPEEKEAEVALHVQGLLAGSVYHYRVVAVREPAPGSSETVYGPDQTFTTQVAGGELALPDGRMWEMVSPAQKQGASIEPFRSETAEEQITQAADDGDAISYLASIPTELQPPGYDAFMQVLSRRTAAGWISEDIAVPHEKGIGAGIGQGKEFRFFSADLSRAVVQPFGSFDSSLSAEASEQTAFLRTDFAAGDAEDPCPTSCYKPLVTGAPGFANVPPGTTFGTSAGVTCPRAAVCGPRFVGATPDTSHIVLEASTPLADGEGLYEWSGGKLTFIGQGLFGGQGAIANEHAISDDGSRVVFSSYSRDLFMRDTAKGETIALDAVQGGTGSGVGGARLLFVSPDGSKVLFKDEQRLTSDAGAAEGAADIYECQMVEEAGQLHCRLTDLTPISAGEPTEALGLLGASEDGSWIYFVANRALAAGAVHGDCRNESGSVKGECNLYVRHDGAVKLVAVLAGQDSSEWSGEEGSKAQVSSDGGWLAFMSQRQLTTNPVRDNLSGHPDEEVYLYDASTGRVVCASCDPTGARPSGTEYGPLRVDPAGYGELLGREQWLAASLPTWTRYEGGGAALYHSRALVSGGRLFFNSDDALVPQDVDGTWDTYEYEPPGVGSCSTASSTYSARSEGCVGLISSGTSPVESLFVDASASGGDVFFWTAVQLSAQDYDTAADIYDAHECTSTSPCPPAQAQQPPPCETGDACKPAPTPQPAIYGAPSSATFSGAGNIVAASPPTAQVKPKKSAAASARKKLTEALRACRGKPRRRRASCERRARARYAPRHAKTKKGNR